MSKTMLYKSGGKHKLHGGMFDYIIVDDDNVEAECKNGWFKTTPEALEGNKPKRVVKEPKYTGKVSKAKARAAVKKVSK